MDAFPDACDPAYCVCEAVGYKPPRPGAPTHVVYDTSPIKFIQYCDEPGDTGKHVLHESGRCRCRPEDGRYRRRG